MKIKYVLAFDPGGTTGWALGYYSDKDPLAFLDGGQITGGVDGFVKWAWEMEDTIRLSSPVIVSESFNLRPAVKFPDVMPLRIEGAMTAIFGPGTVIYQPPAAKSLITDNRLRANGLWIPGQRHHMDARIHALAYARKILHPPTLRKYWIND